MKGQFKFTTKERINQPQDFRRVMKSGRKVQSRSFIFFVHTNRLGFHRLGMVVKREVGPATYRNRIKRYLREFFRLHKHRITGSFDIIILAKKGYQLGRYREAEDELKRLFLT